MLHQFLAIMCACCGHVFDVPVYCGDRFCPVCSVGRRIRIRRRLEFLIDQVKVGGGYSIKHLTLTIKNQSDLSVMVRKILQSFKKLRQTKSWRYHVKGGAFVIEITGSPGNWHVHLHIVILSRWYSWKSLIRLWMKLSTGRGVWIEDIEKRRAVHYLTKYLSKGSVSEANRPVLNFALKGTRLFQPFGSWYALNRQYKAPPKHCQGCSTPCFMLYGDVFSEEGGAIWKEVLNNSP